MIITIQRRGGSVRVRVLDGGLVGVFRSEQAGMEFARRVFGNVEIRVQEEFNFAGRGSDRAKRVRAEGVNH